MLHFRAKPLILKGFFRGWQTFFFVLAIIYNKKRGYKWILYTKDGKKKLGEFRTKKNALKRERQIIYFKNLKK